jgi:hypothetical protein
MKKIKEYAEKNISQFIQAVSDDELTGQAETLFMIHGRHLCPNCMRDDSLYVLQMQMHRLKCVPNPPGRPREKIVHWPTIQQMISDMTCLNDSQESVVSSVIECSRCSVRWRTFQEPVPSTDQPIRQPEDDISDYQCPKNRSHTIKRCKISMKAGNILMHAREIGVYCVECNIIYGLPR